MRLVVVRIVSGEQPLMGYLRRYMFEIESGLLVGSVTHALETELLATLEGSGARGYLLVSDNRDAAGYRIPYFHMSGASKIDMDGIQLIEKRKNSIT